MDYPGFATGTKQRMIVGDDVSRPTKVFASSGAKCIIIILIIKHLFWQTTEWFYANTMSNEVLY